MSVSTFLSYVSPNVATAMVLSFVPCTLLIQFIKMPIDHWLINPSDPMHDWSVKAINLCLNSLLVCSITALLPGGFAGGKDVGWAILGSIVSYLASDALYTNVRGPQPVTPVNLAYRGFAKDKSEAAASIERTQAAK